MKNKHTLSSKKAVSSCKKNSIFFRQNWVEIDKSDFLFNLKKIKSYIAKDTKIMPVLKANAYSHGSVILAKEAQKIGISDIAVGTLEEGIQLRESGIKGTILILGSIYPYENFQVALAHSLTPTISNMQDVLTLENLTVRLNKKINIHLQVDTGMGRIGVLPETVYTLLNKISKISHINMTGLYTHFAVADTDTDFTKLQLIVFSKIVKYARQELGLKLVVHAANSAALLQNKRTHFDMVRPGISLYGFSPFKHSENILKLKPVLSWKTRVTFLKKVSSGFCVSYGRTFVTNKLSVIATIPVGYADGYSRLLSNKSDVLIRGKRCPVIGRVTMDMMMVDVTEIKGVSLGDEVVLIGLQGKEQIKIDELAKIQETINYEVLCSISSRVPRIIV